MITPTEFQDLFKKMVLGGSESTSAYKAYCRQRCHANQSQVELDNRFLNFVATQETLDHCSSEVLELAAITYGQNDGYSKPSRFIELLERSTNQPLPNLHRAYLSLPPEVCNENLLRNIRLQSQSLAVENNATAQSILGFLYAAGRGVPAEELPHKDTLAVTWLRKAADQGDAIAQSILGFMYAVGRGVPAEELPQKDILAFAWYRKAAAQGHAFAQCKLGMMCAAGQGVPARDLPRKDSLAFALYREAADQGESRAQCNLGIMYANERVPARELPQKATLAVVYFRKAAEQRDPLAQYNLGAMYEHGQGIPDSEKPDKEVMAYVWYTKSAAQNYQKAKDHLSRLKINPDQKKKAEMMLARNLSYRQVECLVKERPLKGLILISLILQNKTNNANQKSKIESLPTDLLFQIAQQLVSLSELEFQDMTNKFIVPFRFKIQYRRASRGRPEFFKDSPVAAKVNLGEPLLRSEVEKYANENPKSLEADVYNQLVVKNNMQP